jgi:hypothetical protein
MRGTCKTGILAASAALWIAAGAAWAAPSNPARETVIKLVAQIRTADYEGDRAALARLSAELAPFTDDKEIGSRVLYWRGFALWRRALNGFNGNTDPKELETDLQSAVEEFDRALAKDAAFVDAKVGAISCLSNLLYLNQKNPARVQELLAKGAPLSKEAQAEAPANPRLLWVLGPNQWYTPPERGGGQAKALETYQKGLEAARKQRGTVTDPLEPSWGEPELLMNLAWSNQHRTEPDLNAAEKYAQSALELVPNWHYVRDILLPQIREAKEKARAKDKQ